MPQIITAAAALGGVGITLIATGSRDKRRTLFDRQQKQLDRCTDVFTDFLGTIEEHKLGWRPYIDTDARPVFRTKAEHLEVRKMLVKISLLAPEVYRAANDLYGAYRNLSEGNQEATYYMTDDEEFNEYSDGSNMIRQDVLDTFARQAELVFKAYLSSQPVKDLTSEQNGKILADAMARNRALTAQITRRREQKG